MDSSIRKIIWKFAYPATIENLLQFLVGFIDTLMITRIGLMAVTAVGVANSVLNVYLSVFIALGTGTTALLSRKFNSKEKEQAPIIAFQSILIAVGIGLFFGVVTLLLGRPFLELIAGEQEVVSLATQFFFIVGGGAALISLMTTFSSILRAIGDMKTPMKATFVVNIINIVLSYFFVFILDLGVQGLAFGTLISRLMGCAFLFSTIQKTEVALSMDATLLKSDFKPLVKLTIPATLERLVMRFGQVLYFSLIVMISVTTFASHMIIGTIEGLITMSAYGLATAVTTLVGQSLGAKKYQDIKTYTFHSTKYAIMILSVFGVLLLLFGADIARIFTDDPDAIRKIVLGSRVLVINLPALATWAIVTGSLQGMGDTKSPLYSTIVGMWGIRVISVIVLSIHFNFGIIGVWVSIGIDLYMRAIFLSYRFRKNMKKFQIQEARYES